MKKTMQLLTIILLMFIGINVVNAEEGNTETFEGSGSCNLIKQTYPTVGNEQGEYCQYRCSVKNDAINLDFYYDVEVNSSNFNSSLGVPENPLGVALKYSSVLANEPSIEKFSNNGRYICPYLSTKINRIKEETNFLPAYTDYITIEYVNDYANEDIDDDSSCGLLGGESSKAVSLLNKIFNYVKIAIPLLIILLSIADFLKVVFSGKDDDMKKSLDKFAKRIIIAVIFTLVPLLISLVINISGVTSQYSKINDGLKAIFCIVK